jgi:hypothetical protein
MKLAPLAALPLCGCMLLWLPQKHTHDPSTRPAPVYEPGMAELEVTDEGIYYGLQIDNGEGDLAYELWRGPVKVLEGELADHGWRVGGIEFHSQRARPLGDFIQTHGPLDAGDYSLKMHLKYSDEYGDKHEAFFQQDFSVEHVASTTGGSASLRTSTLTAHAAIRLGPGDDPYLEYGPQGENDKLEVPNPALWITLPTSLAQAETRVDMLFTHDGQLGAHAIRIFALDSNMAHDVLQMPVRVWAWPKEWNKHTQAKYVGAWQVHVVQDGRYVTTCAFVATKTGFTSAAPGATQMFQSALLDCARQTGADVALAMREVKGFQPYAPDPKKAKEALALSRSKEVRDARVEVLRWRRAVDVAEGSGGVAARQADEAITESQERRAQARADEWREVSGSAQQQLKRAQVRYDALIEKYARQQATR